MPKNSAYILYALQNLLALTVKIMNKGSQFQAQRYHQKNILKGLIQFVQRKASYAQVMSAMIM